jgi:hypothetical protein
MRDSKLVGAHLATYKLHGVSKFDEATALEHCSAGVELAKA